MSQEGNHEFFLWKKPSWELSNADSSCNNRKISGEKPPGFRPFKLTITECEPEQISIEESEPEQLSSKKRSYDDGVGERMTEKSKGEANREKIGGESDHEIHIWTERERRKKMRNMFANLHALLPQLPPKADKSTIVDEAVNYIKSLQSILEKLENQKAQRHLCVTTLNYEPSSMITTQSFSYESREAFLANQGSSSNDLPKSGASSSASSPIFRHPISFQTWTSPNIVLNICGDEAMISICSPKKPGLLTAICYVLEKHRIQVVSAQISSDCTRSLYMIQAHVAGASKHVAEVLTVEETFKQAISEIMIWTSS